MIINGVSEIDTAMTDCMVTVVFVAPRQVIVTLSHTINRASAVF